MENSTVIDKTKYKPWRRRESVQYGTDILKQTSFHRDTELL